VTAPPITVTGPAAANAAVPAALAAFADRHEQSAQFVARQPDGTDLLCHAAIAAEHRVPTSDPDWPAAFAEAVARAGRTDPSGRTLFVLPGSAGRSPLQGDHDGVVAPVLATERVPAAPAPTPRAPGPPLPMAGPGEYRAAVAAVLHRLADDRLRQVVLAHWHPCQAGVALRQWLARLWACAPDAQYAYWLRLGAVELAGRCSLDYLNIADGRLCAAVLGGTAPAVGEHTAKEHAEHRGLVAGRQAELAAHGLAVAVAEAGSVVTVGRTRYLRSLLTAPAQVDERVGRLLVECWPGSAVTGTPSAAAREVAQAHEPVPRGYFGGAVGVLDWRAGRLTSAALVTCVLTAGGRSYAPVATGITAASTVAGEEREQGYKLSNVLGGPD
jgi:anthranilate/para-aminobenzoate synthase component I